MKRTSESAPPPNFASLLFGKGSSTVGFASKAVASDNDADPGVVVRELIQNALDAAEKRPGAPTAKVEFRFRDVRTRDIPGIKEFQEAFDASCKTHGDAIAASARSQVENIRRALAADTLRVLEVRDNGVGLDSRRMNALLGEGRTDKVGSEGRRSAGSYGLGHFTTFAVTNLQYVLYGGVDAAGATTMSAHAVLASHLVKDGELREPHGYFIKGHNKSDIENWFIFPRDGEVSQFISKPLEEIRESHGSGSVILIPAFNDFREEEQGDFDRLANLILKAAAWNFYPAIRHERLEVSVIQEGRPKKTLRKDSLDGYLNGAESGRDAKRAQAGYRAITEGREEVLTTSKGSVRMYIRMADPLERAQLSIFRNGMFIAAGSTLPNQIQPNRFGACKPFVGVLCFEPTATGGNEDDLYEMLRTSEGEKHLSVAANRLPREQVAVFHKCMRELHSGISDVAGPDDTDQFTPEFLLLNSVLPGRGPKQPNNHPRPDDTDNSEMSEVETNLDSHLVPGPPGPNEDDDDTEEDDDNEPTLPKELRIDRSLPHRQARSVLRALSASRVRLVVQPDEDIPNAMLRLARHSGADASCDAGLPHRYASFTMEGQSDATQEAPIGTLSAGQRKTFDLDLKGDIDVRDVVFVPTVVSAPDATDRKDDSDESASNREETGGDT